MNLMTNIDSIRMQIMRLELQPMFDPSVWDHVLSQMPVESCRYADAQRRMQTARLNASLILEAVTVETPDLVMEQS